MAKATGIRRVRNARTGKPAVDKDGRAVWEVNVSCGADPVTGKYRMAWRRFHGTKTEAQRYRRELEVKKDSGVNLIESAETLREFSAQWLDARRASGDYRENTLKSDKTCLKVVNAYLGCTRLRDLAPQVVDTAYSRMKLERGLSGTTMNHIHKCLSEVLKQAVMYDMIPRNPCERVKAPKRDESPRESLAPEDAARLLGCIEVEERRTMRAAVDVEVRRAEMGLEDARKSLRTLSDVARPCIALTLGDGSETGRGYGSAVGGHRSGGPHGLDRKEPQPWMQGELTKNRVWRAHSLDRRSHDRRAHKVARVRCH